MVQTTKMAQATRNTITLKGSTKIVTEFFAYAVNSILYQRGIYPPDSFKQQKQYGLSIMMTTDTGLTTYLTNVLAQMSDWLMSGALQKMVLVITSTNSKEVLERWTFDLHTDKAVVAGGPEPEKTEKEIVSDIQAIIRQITASVTFLPLLDEPCKPIRDPEGISVTVTFANALPVKVSRGQIVHLDCIWYFLGEMEQSLAPAIAGTFDLLVYTDANSEVPSEWEDSDPRFINNSADVKLRSFTTKVHKVDALVSYRTDVD